MTTGTIFPNIPQKLLAALARAGSERKLARKLGVNILYVSQLLRSGIEPTDKTENGQRIRMKLGLPRKKTKPRKPRRPLLPGEWKTGRRIGRMVRDTKQAISEHLTKL